MVQVVVAQRFRLSFQAFDSSRPNSNGPKAVAI
jgi:hypothetical protein